MQNNFWNQIFFGNSVKDYLIFLSVIISGIVILSIVNYFVHKKLKKWAKKSETPIDDFIVEQIQKNILPILNVIVIYYSFKLLILSAEAKVVIYTAFKVLIIFFAFKLFINIINGSIRYYFQKKHPEENFKNYRSFTNILSAFLWLLAFLLILQNLGFNVTGIITGLGIGGIAIALAAQAILGDLISYFVIIFDKPFRVGDFVSIDDKSGTVQHIGIKTVRLMSQRGEELIFANSDITKGRVHNFNRMESRRIAFNLNIEYESGIGKTKRITEIIKNTIENTKNVRFELAVLKELGQWSIIFEVVYFVNNSSYIEFVKINDEILTSILESLQKEEIKIAYPKSRIALDK